MKHLICAALLVAGLGACATVTRGTTNQIQVRSEPPGAQMVSSLAHSCNTPCTFSVGRKDEFTITLSMPGFRTERIEVGTRVAGAGVAGFAGNVIVGGVVGMGVDAVTGSTLEHYPNPIVVTLQRDAPAHQSQSGPRGRAGDRRAQTSPARTPPAPQPQPATAAPQEAGDPTEAGPVDRPPPPQLHADPMGSASVPTSR